MVSAAGAGAGMPVLRAPSLGTGAQASQISRLPRSAVASAPSSSAATIPRSAPSANSATKAPMTAAAIQQLRLQVPLVAMSVIPILP